MALYTFYPCSPFASTVLRNHPSCAYVSVWEGEREVYNQWRGRASGTSSGQPALEQARAG
jgi:hypothetical protein